jgi:hypothetical protein
MPSFLACSSTPNFDSTFSSKIGLDIHMTSQRCVPEDRALPGRRLRTKNPILHKKTVSNIAAAVMFVSSVPACLCPVVCVNEGYFGEGVGFS